MQHPSHTAGRGEPSGPGRVPAAGAGYPRVSQATSLDYAGFDDPALARLAQSGDREAFHAIMSRYNQRLFRVARAVMRSDDEAEDVLQEAYLRAFAGIGGFKGGATLATWLTTITLNEARGRLRRRRPQVDIAVIEEQPDLIQFPVSLVAVNPELELAKLEIRRLLEEAVDKLPPNFRLVFVLRDVEGCSVEETAAQLEIPPATVKTRLHRARGLLRRYLDAQLSDALRGTFPFLGARCEAITARVLARLDTREGDDDERRSRTAGRTRPHPRR